MVAASVDTTWPAAGRRPVTRCMKLNAAYRDAAACHSGQLMMCWDRC